MEFYAPTPSLPNMSILGFADTYFEAGGLLYDEPPGRGFYLPATNLLCHSIELYLKSVINPASFRPTHHGVFKEETDRRGSHQLSDMLSELIPEYRETLTDARSTLERELTSLEGLFQASRYPFEEHNTKQVLQGKDRIAFDVAVFLNQAVRELTPILVHDDSL